MSTNKQEKGHRNQHNYILLKGEVSLWLIDINQYLSSLDELMSVLDDDERCRANRFKFEKDRNCFVISHGILRLLLGRYLDCLPQSIDFILNQYGKPSLSAEQCSYPLYFNLSHSKEFALVAFTLDQPIGVDIEYMQNKMQADDIVERFFSEKEREEFFLLPDQEKLEGFYNAWTRKEALIKALGKGVSQSLKSFSVTLSPRKKARVISTGEEWGLSSEWQLYDVTSEREYKSAVSWRGEEKRLRFFRY